ncbi:hypothetical protein Salat_2581900 [Sesamum alatum]|uniref:Uncharacterized protein n=1 Tax=Sesamum alatum TaxID=300844 RepID=A0AAE1XMS5_9LAMI|nr:hypothetical protein Salat_2581900 [Sesamum alatum]
MNSATKERLIREQRSSLRGPSAFFYIFRVWGGGFFRELIGIGILTLRDSMSSLHVAVYPLNGREELKDLTECLSLRSWVQDWLAFLRWYCILALSEKVSLAEFFNSPVVNTSWVLEGHLERYQSCPFWSPLELKKKRLIKRYPDLNWDKGLSVPCLTTTTRPCRKKYIWHKTIPYIEVGMGSGVFTSHRSARFVLISD